MARAVARNVTRALVLTVDTFQPRYRAGDVLLVHETPAVYNGLLAIAALENACEIGYYVQFLERRYRLSEEGQLSETGSDFLYLGLILAAIRRENLAGAGSADPGETSPRRGLPG